MNQQKEKLKLDTYWNGYCPECLLKGERVGMKLNSYDFFECEKSALQIVLPFPNFFASILKFRGKGEWRTNSDYAHESPRNELLCKQISDKVPTLDSELNIDYAQFKNTDEIENYIDSEIESQNIPIVDEIERLSKGITGIAGEYFVAAELSMQGFMASITLRNNDSIDIHASKLSNNKIFAIQVKTNQTGERSWPLNEKAENLKAENLFYVFVSFKGLYKRPEYFIVPSTIVADTVKNEFAAWVGTPGKKGQARNKNNPMRKFNDKEGRYKEKWKLLS
ncbi:MAG TPA: hypothetical protein VI757_06980 [Bacteroidia bacterium]|nr:hypothetical protein [Bacteroidia bacterium]